MGIRIDRAPNSRGNAIRRKCNSPPPPPGATIFGRRSQLRSAGEARSSTVAKVSVGTNECGAVIVRARTQSPTSLCHSRCAQGSEVVGYSQNNDLKEARRRVTKKCEHAAMTHFASHNSGKHGDKRMISDRSGTKRHVSG